MRPPILWGSRPTILLTIACVAFAAWACIVAVVTRAGFSPTAIYISSPAGLVLGVALGSWLRRHVGITDLAVWLGLATLVMVLAFLASPGPARDPLVYPNANAALAIQLIGLSGVALRCVDGVTRWALRGSALVAYAVVLLNQSRVGAVVGLLVLAAALVPVRRRGAGRAVASLAAVLVATVAVWVGQVAAHKPWTRALPLPDWVRSVLWEGALTVWSPHPLRGTGPGSFVRGVPLASDPDTASAHSVLMQVGAETGAIGVGLLTAIFLGGLLVSLRSAGDLQAVAVPAWTALTLHALVDHLVDFVPVVLAAGLVLGCAGRRTLSRRSGASGCPGRRQPTPAPRW